MASNKTAARQLCSFKQRRGPFLLLADSMKRALGLCIHLPTALRKAMSQAWPGPVTFIVPAAGPRKSDISPVCFGGRSIGGRAIAIRVDADPACRYLAHISGGLLISSSLNRKNQPVQAPGRRQRMRWHRHLSARIGFGASSGCASSLLKWSGARLHILRGSMPAQN
jgi:L-threonylcarbamoyladenylate synthase